MRQNSAAKGREAPAVKTEECRDMLLQSVKEESYDVKMEDVSLSLSTKLETDSLYGGPKPQKRTRMTFLHLPAVTQTALGTFAEIIESQYQYSDLGESQQEDVMACECKPSKQEDGKNLACGDNDCINFATSMECVDDECSCGVGCRNQRFQRREYADVDVIQTERKGYGIRANQSILQGTFIYEYVGEVIAENTFRSRMHEYDEEGIKHFYFMMIQQGEYIDATKMGGLGRFINHSCSPNCYVDKWVVGTKLRMGIFADRNIQAGEELTFDYNVDRYGADAQPCYCGESNCIGYIGGKTQSEAQPKLSHAVKEALGFDDDTEWSTATSRKRRRPKKDEDEDEDYKVSAQPKPVTEEGVAKIMSTLLQAREQWVIMSHDTAIYHRVLKMHGYQILGSVLREWRSENVIVTTILHVLLQLPRVTKNKIDSSGIEATVKELTQNDNSRVKELATLLLQEWDALEMGFRIARRPKNSNPNPSKDDTPSDSSKPSAVTTTSTVPKAIENTLHRPQKQAWYNHRPVDRAFDPDAFHNVPRGPAATTPQVSHPPLPPGWQSAFDNVSGKTYYYRRSDKKTQWEFPVEEAVSAVVGVQKSELGRIIEEANRHLAEKTAQQKAEEERKRLELEKEEREAAEAKALERAERKQRHERRVLESEKKEGKSKLEKQMSLQFSKYVPNVIAGRYNALTKDEIKKYARDIVHLLVSKEIKAGKTSIKDELSDDKKRKIKIFVKDYMDKVMVRRAQKQAAKQQQQQQQHDSFPSESGSTETPQVPGSTPRDLQREIDIDDVSRRLSVEDENGDVETLSATEFLKKLEMDGLLEG